MREPTQLSEEYLATVGHALRKLARHFGKQLDEMVIMTYMEQLQDLNSEQIEAACSEAIRKLKRMPFVADLRELAQPMIDRVFNPPDYSVPGKYCQDCYPDGWKLVTHPFMGHPYKVIVRCPCQASGDGAFEGK